MKKPVLEMAIGTGNHRVTLWFDLSGCMDKGCKCPLPVLVKRNKNQAVFVCKTCGTETVINLNTQTSFMKWEGKFNELPKFNEQITDEYDIVWAKAVCPKCDREARLFATKKNIKIFCGYCRKAYDENGEESMDFHSRITKYRK